MEILKNIKKLTTLVLFISLLSSALSPNIAQEKGTLPLNNTQNLKMASKFAIYKIFSDTSKKTKAIEKNKDCCNNFACNLYGKLKEDKDNKDKNMLFSPYSISTALSIAYAGADGITKSEMDTILCGENNKITQEQFHYGCSEIIESINKRNHKYTLSVANKLFIQKEFKILPEFKNIIKSNYGAAFDSVDFIDKKRQTSLYINKWIAEKTDNKINNLVLPDSFTPNTKMIIANAIYFKGKWAKQFEKSSTSKQDFHINKDNNIKVDMMNQTNKFNYMENENLQLLELQYQGDRLSMFIILPKDANNLECIENNFTAATLDKYLSKLKNIKVIVDLPKFKIETQYELNKSLRLMGMHTAFIPGANFSKISKTEDLYISQVIHKAFIEVDEEGTKAAAATKITYSKCAENNPKFNANHPFIFFIKDKLTGVILFAGKINNPNPVVK